MKHLAITLVLLTFFHFGLQATAIFNEGFDVGLGQFSAYSVLGNEQWLPDSYGVPAPCAKMSGYDYGAFTNEDWLISPAIDLSGFSSANLSFYEAINFSSNVSAYCKVLISSNYNGTGDPNNAIWTELSMPYRSQGNSWGFVFTGNVSLASFIGQPDVRLAFKYLSDPYEASTWEIDLILVEEETEAPLDSYLDIVTYNIEWLGAPDMAGLGISRSQQINRAAQDILAANADIYALQEIVIDDSNGNALDDLVTELNLLDAGDAWEGCYNEYFSYWWDPDPSFPSQRQAFVYRTSSVSLVSSSMPLDTNFENEDRFASGRLPFLMEADVTINGNTARINLVNLHLKCCSGNSNRRKNSMDILISKLTNSYNLSNMIVLGDLNVADEGGAYGEISDWGIYTDLDGNSTQDYYHAAGAVPNLSSSDIDHILISDELKDAYDAAPTMLQNREIPSTVSDHDLILTALNLEGVISNTDSNFEQVNMEVSFFPNPVAYGSQITLSIPKTKENTSVEVYDLNGRLQLSRQVSNSIANYSLEGLNTGLYLLVIRSGSKVTSDKLFIQ